MNKLFGQHGPQFALVTGLLFSLLLGACGDATSTQVATTSASPTTASATQGTSPTKASATQSTSSTAASTAQGTVPANLKVGPGVDPNAKVIKVGFLGPLTGGVATQGIKYQIGQTVFFKNLNDNGGIDGYKIEMVTQDSQYDPQITVQAYNKMADNIAIFSHILGTPPVTAIKDQAAQDKMVIMYAGSASTLLPATNIIAVQEPYIIDVLNAFDYVTNHLGKKNIKTALIYQDDSLGADGVIGYKEAVKAYGLQDVGQIPFKTTDKDFTGQAAALKNSGADYVYLGGSAPQTAQIASTAASLGFTPHYILQTTAWDVTVMNAAGVKDIYTGALIAGGGASWSQTDLPEINKLVAAMKKYAPNEVEHNFITNGWLQALVTQIILKKALESGDVSRDGILAASQSITNADLGGLLPPLTLGKTANDRVVSRATRINVIDPSLPSGAKVIEAAYMGDAAKNYLFK